MRELDYYHIASAKVEFRPPFVSLKCGLIGIVVLPPENEPNGLCPSSWLLSWAELSWMKRLSFGAEATYGHPYESVRNKVTSEEPIILFVTGPSFDVIEPLKQEAGT